MKSRNRLEAESSLWNDFSNTSLDRFFAQGLREEKDKEFVNLNKGSI